MTRKKGDLSDGDQRRPGRLRSADGLQRALELSAPARNHLAEMVKEQRHLTEVLSSTAEAYRYATQVDALYPAVADLAAQHIAVSSALRTLDTLELRQPFEVPSEALAACAAAARVAFNLHSIVGSATAVSDQLRIASLPSVAVSEQLRERFDLRLADTQAWRNELGSVIGSLRTAVDLFEPVSASIVALQDAIAAATVRIGPGGASVSGPQVATEPFEDDAIIIGPPDEPSGELAIERVERGRLVELVPADLTQFLHLVQDPSRMRLMDGHAFEEFIAKVLDGIGFKDVQLTRRSGDGGIDVWAIKEVEGMAQVWACQCKQTKNPVGPAIGRALLGSINMPGNEATVGLIATTSTFSPSAQDEIRRQPRLHGWDTESIVNWVVRTLRARGLLPRSARG